MNKFKDLISTAVVNGTLAFLLFISYAWLVYGPIGRLDELFVIWIFALTLVGSVNIFINYPVSILLSARLRTFTLSQVLALVGLVCVYAFFSFFTNASLSFESQLRLNWLFYLIFYINGIAYCIQHKKCLTIA
ncbi:hypothetical protein KI655_19710 [Vibrio sp. D404a]|uniref:hypothetical protein n=1 Tax=unclassified Vibrio TaxID=2614977 RepID=UPI0025535CD1|nr:MULTISPECIES: hypothetical protein [unclassified Vibrio]MDK9739524.1 hypothetical protein [Vibrio sp. D404a]MDK9798912.1 hypothetical protein [Vibrio sp. D449a]